jgi:hypothetical protein
VSASDGIIEMQRAYVRLHTERQNLKDKLEEIEGKLEQTEQILADAMVSIGQNSTQIDGKRLTVRVTPRIGKRAEVPMEELCDALDGTEWGWLVKPGVNAQTLQATMKEVVEERGELPDCLKQLLRQWDQIVVAVTKL